MKCYSSACDVATCQLQCLNISILFSIALLNVTPQAITLELGVIPVFQCAREMKCHLMTF